MSKIALLGYGKMGKMIEKIALTRNHQIILKIDEEERKTLTKTMLQKADVVIEFTCPESAVENLLFCLEAQVPVVCGTTGWMTHWQKISEYCNKQQGKMLYASNFSVGVNIFFALNAFLAKLMNKQDYAVQMTEIHHTEKKDAPSGTAISLAEQIIAHIDNKISWENAPTTQKNILPIISERIGKTPGTHIVNYTSTIDDIEIKHTAHNREGFALGSILAAEFLIPQIAGIYNMTQVLKLENYAQ